ncbi:MAG: CarD family transcriptional regulator, partial [Oscillospiraceae bacterium]|nr:CarD family transcriptional regulator [Oscillospiraceae bacterium]
MDLLNTLFESEQYKTLSAALSKGGATALFGVHPIHSAAFAAALEREGRSLIFLTESDAQAHSAAEDLRALGASAARLPSRDLVFLDVESASHELETERLAALSLLASGRCRVLCASVEALCQYTMPPEVFKARSFELKKGESRKLASLTEALLRAGYSRAQRVEGRGQFAVRGGIADVFPAGEEHPLRLEFFGDEIDRIALFDEDSQRRIKELESALITPVREVAFDEGAAEKLFALAENCKKAAELARLARRDALELEGGLAPASLDRYLFAAYDRPATAADYLPEALLFISEPSAVRRRHKSLTELHFEELTALKEQGFLQKEQQSFYLEDLRALEKERPRVLAEAFTRGEGEERLAELINVRASVTPRWNGELALLTEDVSASLALGYSCVVLAPSERAVKTVAGDLRAAGFEVTEEPGETPPAPSVSVTAGTLTTGFQLAAGRLSVIASAKETVKKTRHRRRDERSKEISRLEDLREGDLVVHDMHGIGRFEGIHRIDHHGFVRDYIKISYRGADVLYVPVTQLDMVSQYISPSEGEVKLAKLHSGEWAKTKAAVYRSVKEMAEELIALYAKRESERGVAFSEDGEWQQNFEARFEYEETPDQLRTVEEIKADMERPRPMDRVLCGDVGVGKTEVALRAAFKCVNDGYQCAVLVPTTILAWQHYRTICERMEAFPIKVAMLSRFATAKEIKAAAEGIKKGTVD